MKSDGEVTVAIDYDNYIEALTIVPPYSQSRYTSLQIINDEQVHLLRLFAIDFGCPIAQERRFYYPPGRSKKNRAFALFPFSSFSFNFISEVKLLF